MKRPLMILAALFYANIAVANTLVENVNGYTHGAKGNLERFNAVLIDEDGRVVRLYSKGETLPKEVKLRVDGKRRTMLPGIIDAHGHVSDLGMKSLQLDLSETRSLEEALEKLRAYAAANPKLPWILGRGWNQERWNLGRFPTAAELDAVVGDRPVWLERIDSHAGWANSLAMRVAQINAHSDVPAGGKIELLDGHPSGVLVGGAQRLMARMIPQPSRELRDRALDSAQKLLLSHGITSVADMGMTSEDWATMRRAGDADRLQIRIVGYARGFDTLDAIGLNGPTAWLYRDRLRLVGMKFLVDGALGSRGAFLKRPYADAPAENGLAVNSEAALTDLIRRATDRGLQVALHAIGDAGNARALDAINMLAPNYPADRRWRIEHAQIVDPLDLPRFAQHGIVASMQPVHQTSDWRMAERRMGVDRLKGAYAWKSMIDQGAVLAFGSDFPVENENPFEGIAVAVSRTDAQGQPQGGWFPEQRVETAQALAGFTRDAAYAGFAEDRLGTLQPGKLADFVMIDRDIFQSGADAIRKVKVLETWVGGRKLWQVGPEPDGKRAR